MYTSDLDEAINSAHFMKELYEQKYNELITNDGIVKKTDNKQSLPKTVVSSSIDKSIMERLYRNK